MPTLRSLRQGQQQGRIGSVPRSPVAVRLGCQRLLMPVVINEFEVVAGGPGSPTPATAPAPPAQPRLLDLEREIERVARVRSEREQRLTAD